MATSSRFLRCSARVGCWSLPRPPTGVDLVPRDSLSSRVARHLLKQEPWLLWSLPESDSKGMAEEDDFEDALIYQIQRFLLGSQDDLRAKLRLVSEHTFEPIAARDVSGLGARRAFETLIGLTGSTKGFMQSLVLSLGLPRATIEQMIVKIAAQPGAPGNPDALR